VEIDELHAAAKRNIARTVALTAGRTGEVTEDDRLALIVGPASLASAFVNAALRIDDNLSAADALGEATEYFGTRGHPFVFWTDDGVDADVVALLAAAGARSIDTSPLPGMVADEPLSARLCTQNAVHVDGPGELAALLEIVTAVYDFGLPMDQWLGGWPLPDAIAGYVLRDRGVPVSTATAVADEVGGIYLVATPHRHRRRGYGAAITVHATNQLFEAGVRAVTLQASAAGVRIYSRMGYRTYTTFTRWVVDAAS
jgi:hypothetical protein